MGIHPPKYATVRYGIYVQCDGHIYGTCMAIILIITTVGCVLRHIFTNADSICPYKKYTKYSLPIMCIVFWSHN